MSFFYKPYIHNSMIQVNSKIKKISLQNQLCDAQRRKSVGWYAIHSILIFNKTTNKLNRNRIIRKKRTSFSTSRQNASLSVEAAMAFPVFIFAMIFLTYFTQIVYVNNVLQQNLLNTARAVSVYAYEGSSPEALSYTWLLSEVGKDFVETSGVVGGLAGLDLSKTHFDEKNQRVTIVLRYKVRNIADIFGLPAFPVTQRVSFKLWTGCRGNENKKDGFQDPETRMVYITDTGNVYHLSRECTHLDLSIALNGVNQISSMRNENGAKYSPCDRCCKNVSIGDVSEVYTTNWGVNYHQSIGCSGLKRTISEVEFSDALNYPPCSRCGR